MSQEAIRARLQKLLAESEEASAEMSMAWGAIARKFPDDETLERLGSALVRYLNINTVIKAMAIAVLQKHVEA